MSWILSFSSPNPMNAGPAPASEPAGMANTEPFPEFPDFNNPPNGLPVPPVFDMGQETYQPNYQFNLLMPVDRQQLWSLRPVFA